MCVYTCGGGRGALSACAEGLRAKESFLLGLCPKMKNEWNKWKNHFYEMKGGVGMSAIYYTSGGREILRAQIA